MFLAAAVLGYCTLFHVQTKTEGLGWIVRSNTYQTIVPYRWPGSYFGAVAACEKFSRKMAKKEAKRERKLRALSEYTAAHECCLCNCRVADTHRDCHPPCRASMAPHAQVTYPVNQEERANCEKQCAALHREAR